MLFERGVRDCVTVRMREISYALGAMVIIRGNNKEWLLGDFCEGLSVWKVEVKAKGVA